MNLIAFNQSDFHFGNYSAYASAIFNLAWMMRQNPKLTIELG
jgi:hypothetical protein